METALNAIRNRFDRTGIVLSGLCAVHCVLSIVIVSVLGLGAQFLLNPSIHEVGLALAVAFGLLSLGLGVLRHGRFEVLAIGGCGLALMAAALAVEHGVNEALLTIAGVALLSAAHLRNLRHAS